MVHDSRRSGSWRPQAPLLEIEIPSIVPLPPSPYGACFLKPSLLPLSQSLRWITGMRASSRTALAVPQDRDYGHQLSHKKEGTSTNVSSIAQESPYRALLPVGSHPRSKAGQSQPAVHGRVACEISGDTGWWLDTCTPALPQCASVLRCHSVHATSSQHVLPCHVA